MNFWTLNLFAIAQLTAVHCSAAQSHFDCTTQNHDTLYHKYINGAVSVAVGPWQEGRRGFTFYDLYGIPTYFMEEIQGEDSTYIALQFFQNGAVSEALVPAHGDVNSSKCTIRITFSSTNSPEHRFDLCKDDAGNDQVDAERYFWHRNEKRWAQQEVIMCFPPR